MQPIRSLRHSTRAAQLRNARTCYDHLAGRLGVGVTQALIDTGALVAEDGIADARRRPGDHLSSQLPRHPYTLGPNATQVLLGLGVPADRLTETSSSRRPLLRFCLDWSEQRHHLAGRLGADLLDAFVDARWITRMPGQRAVRVTDTGRHELRGLLGLPKVTNGPTETLNNLIKRIKRIGFGFRNFANYRIRALLYAGKPNWRVQGSIVVQ